MSIDVPHASLNGEFLAIEGIDALAFAQAQTMNDVGQLRDDDWQWSGWLTPKGRLVAFFAVLRRSEQALLLWLPAGGAAALRERLQRYVFRSKVKLGVRDDLVPVGVFDAVRIDDARMAQLRPVACLSMSAPDGSARTLLVAQGVDAGQQQTATAASAPEPAAPRPEARAEDAAGGQAVDSEHAPRLTTDSQEQDDIAALTQWQLADLRAGVPYIAAGAANSEQFVPQWLSLERLSAFSVKKGCYPGQEIVARMHFLGQSKRGAYVLDGEGAAPAPMSRVLTADGGSAGEIVWSLSLDGTWQALAALSVDKAATATSVEGAADVHVSVGLQQG